MKKNIALFWFICLSVILMAACSTAPEAEVSSPVEDNVVEESTAVQPAQDPTNSDEMIEPTLAEGEVIVSSSADFEAAVSDPTITVIQINTAIDLTSELTFERNDDLEIRIEKEGILTVNSFFSPVGCSILNAGTIIVNDAFERGISTLINNGSITINAGGLVSSGMSNTENYGVFSVEAEAELLIDRGAIFNNYGTLTNNGHIQVSDGGQLNDEGGAITNDGTLDLSAYFNGNIDNITGTGTLNDSRE